MGAVLVGSKEFIEQAWYYKFQIGGGMHQAGIIAAGCLYGLKNNINSLEEDHKKTNYLVECLSNIEQIAIDSNLYNTNISYFTLVNPPVSENQLVDILIKEYGIRMSIVLDKIRVITHRDISYENIDTTVFAIKKILGYS